MRQPFQNTHDVISELCSSISMIAKPSQVNKLKSLKVAKSKDDYGGLVDALWADVLCFTDSSPPKMKTMIIIFMVLELLKI